MLVGIVHGREFESHKINILNTLPDFLINRIYEENYLSLLLQPKLLPWNIFSLPWNIVIAM